MLWPPSPAPRPDMSQSKPDNVRHVRLCTQPCVETTTTGNLTSECRLFYGCSNRFHLSSNNRRNSHPQQRVKPPATIRSPAQAHLFVAWYLVCQTRCWGCATVILQALDRICGRVLGLIESGSPKFQPHQALRGVPNLPPGSLTGGVLTGQFRPRIKL